MLEVVSVEVVSVEVVSVEVVSVEVVSVELVSVEVVSVEVVSVEVVSVIGISVNKASIIVFEFIVTLIVEFVEFDPFHPENSYPSLGVAVILTEDPSSYVPPEVETDPPVPAVTVRLYCVTEVVVDDVLP